MIVLFYIFIALIVGYVTGVCVTSWKNKERDWEFFKSIYESKSEVYELIRLRENDRRVTHDKKTKLADDLDTVIKSLDRHPGTPVSELLRLKEILRSIV